MNKEEIIKQLKEIQKCGDQEKAHGDADDLLLEYIDDEEIEAEYNKIDKWYA